MWRCLVHFSHFAIHYSGWTGSKHWPSLCQAHWSNILGASLWSKEWLVHATPSNLHGCHAVLWFGWLCPRWLSHEANLQYQGGFWWQVLHVVQQHQGHFFGTPEEDIPGSHVTKLADCILSTDQEVLDAFQVCKDKCTTLSKKHFEMWEKASGITFNHHALLLNQTLLDSNLLKPISGYIHDWMHTMASQGVIQRSIWLLLSQLDMWDQLEPFLQLWTLPKAMAKAGNLHDLFQTKRIKFYKENSKFKCTASEAIGLSTLLAYLVNTICVPAAAHLDQCHSFLAMVQQHQDTPLHLKL